MSKSERETRIAVSMHLLQSTQERNARKGFGPQYNVTGSVALPLGKILQDRLDRSARRWSAGIWHVTWINPVSGAHNVLIGKKHGEGIL